MLTLMVLPPPPIISRLRLMPALMLSLPMIAVSFCRKAVQNDTRCAKTPPRAARRARRR